MKMMEKSGDGGSSANNSSDFVRKLYKMLEDPSYEKIVRWGEGGESFVVLETDKFTKHILPKHFKHSNFASFVRQLNKYDFHKVRQTNEDTTPSPYGSNAWEFRHPDFQANNKDALDNIRRKAPAPRKSGTAGAMPDDGSAQHVDLVNNQMLALQQQLHQLSERYQDLASSNSLLLNQVFELQKYVKHHDGVMRRVIDVLKGVDGDRRTARFATGSVAGSPQGLLPASPLQRVSSLLDDLSADKLPNVKLEQLSHDLQVRHDIPTPTTDAMASAPLTARSEASNSNVGFLAADIEQMVYPVGATNGIDPISSDHINSIPYGLPEQALQALPSVATLPLANGIPRPKANESAWPSARIKVLLVEDDLTCARIGAKFLEHYNCDCVHAVDGMDAVSKINAAPGMFDLILMDIIMPHLDGVSATVLIRGTRPDIPIVAMTSNIRAHDIDLYFKHGMNDVLPKPFTKESMLRAIQKALPTFQFVNSRDSSAPPTRIPVPPPLAQQSNGSVFITPSTTQAPLQLSMASLAGSSAMKEDPSPIGKSPATSTSWHSPGPMPGPSPIGPIQGGYVAPSMRESAFMTMGATHPHPSSGYPSSVPLSAGPGPPRNAPMRRPMADMGAAEDDHPEKRQRMYTR